MANIPIAGSFEVAGGVVTFTPTNPLPAGKVVTTSITTTLRGTENERLATAFDWSFTTAGLMEFVSIAPDDEAVEVLADAVIVVTFDTNLDGMTVTTSTITVVDDVTPVPGSWQVDNKVATFTPTSDFDFNSMITVTVTTNVRGIAGEELAEAAGPFTFLVIGDVMLAPTTEPEDDDTGVSAASTIEAEFAVDIDEATVSDVTFVVTYDDGQV